MTARTTAPHSPLIVGADVGGTFTDLVATDGNTIRWIGKVPSTPERPSDAIQAGLELVCLEANRRLEDVVLLLHGTTIATNAVLQRRGAETALITTRGFRDVLEIARQARPRLFDFDARRPAPLIPRRFRLEVEERLDASGDTVAKLDVDGLRATVEFLRANGVESVAVCFLHSYVNGAHERLAREVIRSAWPEVFVTLSHEISGEYREFERFSTSAVNAFVAPVMQRYLTAIEEDLRERQSECVVQVMQSNGGMMSVARACRRPAATVLSGVAAGALGGVRLAHAAGRTRVLTLDMGGTSCDMAVGSGGAVMTSRTSEVGGLPVRLPTLDVHTIGAGGGSIAYLDSGGGIHVGPRSAGAVPGPVCYGTGGTQPTVTDANVVLGRIPSTLLGGRMSLQPDLARSAISREIADPLGITVDEAALGIVRVVNAGMARQMRVLTIQRGLDPRDFSLVAFGGGGPAHAVELARELEMKEVIIPPMPGVTSAVGLLVADISYDRVRTVLIDIEGDAAGSAEQASFLAQSFAEMAEEIQTELVIGNSDNRLVTREVEMRYRRQGHELRVTLPDGPISSDTLSALERLFHDKHKERFGYGLHDQRTVVVTAVLTIAVLAANRDVPAVAHADYRTGDTSRSVLFGTEWCDAKVLPRMGLEVDTPYRGPLILEQVDSTTVVPPEATVLRDAFANLIIVDTLVKDAEAGASRAENAPGLLSERSTA